jgi:hypothetical protein
MSCNPLHSNQKTADGIHIPYAFEYADTSARTGATGLTTDDVGKFARQLDDDSIWMLINEVGPVWVPISGGSTSFLSSSINELEEAIQTILKDLDGYHPDITGTEHYNQISQSLQTILQSLDGYGSITDLQGMVNTELEHTIQESQVFQSILQSLDGYHPDVTGIEHYNQQSQINQSILQALDGYAQNITYTENKNAQQQINQSIIQGMDGYALTLDAYSPSNHRNLDQLVHNIAETSYEEVTYSNGLVSNVTVYTDSGKATNIREEQYVYSSFMISTITYIQYNSSSVEVERVVETYTWNGNNILSVSRVLTLS